MTAGTLPYYLAIRRYLIPLPDREAGPQPRSHWYRTLDAYFAAYHLWRVILRDADLTEPERDARLAAALSFAGTRYWCDWCDDMFDPQYVTVPGFARMGPAHRGAGGPFDMYHGLREVEIGVQPFGDRQWVTWIRDPHSGRYL